VIYLIIVIARTFIVYIAIILSMRIMGKRQLGELEPSELVVAILIADLAAHPLQDIGIPLLNGLIPVAVLLSCELIVSGLLLRSIRARTIICGRPSMLVADGKIDQREMRKSRFTIDELTEKLRGKGVTDISKVKYGILETDGTLSVIPFPGEQAASADQLNIQTQDTGYPTIIINNGKVLLGNLELMGRDEPWLARELKLRGIASHRDVYLLSVNHAGQVYCNIREAT